MKYCSNCKKRFILILFSLLIGLFSLYAQSTVISPTSGLWANYQSLVLNLPDGYEAYYSLTGENPLVSGFAYDGPVLLELSGDVKVAVRVVAPDKSSQSYSIEYSVNLQSPPSYIPITSNDPTVILDYENPLRIPSTVKYSLGQNSAVFNGQALQIGGELNFKRFINLTLYDNSIPYKYVLQLGNDMLFDESQLLNTQYPIEVSDWNYVSFKTDEAIIYSIDGQPLRQSSSGRIYIDRTDDKTISWRAVSEDTFNTFFLPKKPTLLGVPSSAAVNTPVNISLSDPRFKFGWSNNGKLTMLSENYFIDTLLGDAFGFSEDIDIYYEGIKQGTFNVTFILDKIAPDTPVFTTTDSSGYARDNITINIQTSDRVQYYIPTPITSSNGFNSAEKPELYNSNSINKEVFLPLESNTLTLTNTSGRALLYTLYMFTTDLAGNSSEIVSFSSVVDPYNYYIQERKVSNDDLGIGTKDRPFNDINQMIKILNKTNLQNIYIDGFFNEVPSLTITKDTAFILTDTSRLLFTQDSNIEVVNSITKFSGGTLEQRVGNKPNQLHTTFISANNSTLLFENTEFLLIGCINATLIDITNSKLDMLNSGLTVQTEAYGAGIRASNSTLKFVKNRNVLSSETSVGISTIDSIVQVADSSFTNIGQHSRSIELIDSSFTLQNNSFIYEGDILQHKSYPAVWVDERSNENEVVGNNIKGYTYLLNE